MKKITFVVMIASALFASSVSLAQAPAASGAAAAKPLSAAQFVGTWTKKDNPKITWKFNSDGTTLVKTPSMEFPGTYTVEGSVLSMKGKDVPLKKYDVMELTGNSMKLDDQEYKVVSEFSK